VQRHAKHRAKMTPVKQNFSDLHFGCNSSLSVTNGQQKSADDDVT